MARKPFIMLSIMLKRDAAIKAHQLGEMLGGQYVRDASGHQDSASCRLTDLSPELKWHTLRGMFEVSGDLGFDTATKQIQLTFTAICFQDDVSSTVLFTDIPSAHTARPRLSPMSAFPVEVTTITGPDVSSVIESMFYWCPEEDTNGNKKMRVMARLCQLQTMCQQQQLELQVVRMDPSAALPKKAIASDAGYDLTLIRLAQQKGSLYMYDTGVSVCPPPGFYLDMVPRSSIIKSGYMLANSVGVIDPAYRGSIKVPLIKIDPDAPDLELPQRLVQLIPRRVHNLEVTELSGWTQQTQRGEAGFGSTGTN